MLYFTLIVYLLNISLSEPIIYYPSYTLITAKNDESGGKSPVPILELLNLARPFAALRAVDMDIIAGKIVAALASA
jgi:hypothetical protein